MSQRRFLEDNENIQGEGKATHYAASQDSKQTSLNQETPTTWSDWLGIFAMMGLTYLMIVLIWIIGMYGIEEAFEGTVILFIVLFVIYVVVVAFLWSKGLSQRQGLIEQLIQQKALDNQVEFGAAP